MKQAIVIALLCLGALVACSDDEPEYRISVADVQTAFDPVALDYLQNRTVLWRGGHAFIRPDSLVGPERDSVLAVWRGLDAVGRDIYHVWGRDGYVLFYRQSDEVVAWVDDCAAFESDPVIVYNTYSYGDRCTDTEWLELHITLPPWP